MQGKRDIECLAEGDMDGFSRIFMHYYPKLKVFIGYLVKSEQVAEDLSQDIFEDLWKSRNNLSVTGSLNAYLYGRARNKACNSLTRHKFENKYRLSLEEMREYTIDAAIDAKDLELLVLMAVEKMPEKRRRVFELSRYEGMKNAEIAGKLGISLKTVENHINHAIKHIKEVICVLILLFFS